MKRTIPSVLLISLMIISINAISSNHEIENVKKYANQFLASKIEFANNDNNPKLSMLATYSDTLYHSNINNQDNPLIYIFDINKSGFIILAKAIDGYKVIGFSLKNKMNMEAGIPPALKTLLNEWILLSKSNLINVEKKPSFYKEDNIDPLISTQWNQTAPYNLYVPNNCLVGCTGVALAQQIKYWADIEEVTGYGQIEEINYAATDYDWGNMPTTLDGATNDEINNVAELLYHSAITVESNFGSSATWAMPENIIIGSVDNYSFNPDAFLMAKRKLFTHLYTDEEWHDKIYESLVISEPVIYTAANHAFNCDGYQDGFFHFNFGWGGTSDGYFLLAEIGPLGNPDIYTHNIIMGVKPSINTISENTTWSGTVEINESIAVIANATLTITEGTQVNFNGHHKLFITGSISAIGSEDSPIIFTGIDESGFYGLNILSRNSETPLLIHVKVENSHKPKEGEYGWGITCVGGAIYEDSRVGIHLNNITIENCSAFDGGGLLLSHGGIFSNLHFNNLPSPELYTYPEGHGGGLYISPYETELFEFVDCSFNGIEINTPLLGNAIYSPASSAETPTILKNCVFNDINGGQNMISVFGDLQIENCVFKNNDNLLDGFFRPYSESDFIISIANSLFTDNQVEAMITTQGETNLLIFNSTFIHSSPWNSALFANGSETHYPNIKISNCVFWTDSPNEYEFIVLADMVDITIHNTILKFGFDGISINDNIGMIIDTANLFNENPMFQLQEPHQYQVVLGSPAIDNGEEIDESWNLPEYDLAGNPRINNNIDIGAYEYFTGLEITNISAYPNMICPLENCQLNITTTGGSGSYNYSWTSIPAGFTSSQQNPMVNPAVSTIYYVEISDGVNSVLGEIEVIVNELPFANAGEDQLIALNGTTQLLGTSSGGSGFFSYSWANHPDNDPQISIAEPNAQITEVGSFPVVGSFLFTLISTDLESNCVSEYDTIMISIAVGAEEITNENITVYPNPISTSTTVVVPPGKPYSLKVLNTQGQILYSKSSFKNKCIINTEKFDKGLYFIELRNSKQIITKRLIVQ